MVRPLLVLGSMFALLQVAPAAQEAKSPSTPLKVQVVLSRYDGEKKLASIPYTLLVNAGDHDNRATLRMGVSLPVASPDKNGAITYHDVGTNMDCAASNGEGGRFRINLSVNHTSVYESDAQHLQAAIPRPGNSAQLLRSFTSSSVLNLKDGETGQSIAATDPVTGEVRKIDVTVRVVR